MRSLNVAKRVSSRRIPDEFEVREELTTVTSRLLAKAKSSSPAEMSQSEKWTFRQPMQSTPSLFGMRRSLAM